MVVNVFIGKEIIGLDPGGTLSLSVWNEHWAFSVCQKQPQSLSLFHKEATLEAEKGSQSRDAKIHSSLEAGSKSESISVVFNVKNAEP